MQKIEADLHAAFTSLKFIPMPFALSTNTANPKLILFDDHIEYRGGFSTNQLRYRDIREVNVYFLGRRTNNLIISKRNGISTFIANFKSRDQLKEFLKMFNAKGCELSSKAEGELVP